MNGNKNKRSFTLLELIVTLAILAIIFSYAIPSYERYVLKTRFDEAKNTIQKIMLAQERYRAKFGTYYFMPFYAIRNEDILSKSLEIDLSTSNNFVYSIQRGDDSEYVVRGHLRPEYDVCNDGDESKKKCVQNTKLTQDNWVNNYVRNNKSHFIRFRYPNFFRENDSGINIVENGFDYTHFNTEVVEDD